MIQIQNTSKSFKGVPAVQNLNLEVGEGEILGLLGANGAGKSTTIHMLLGFITPDSGTVAIYDMDVTKKAGEVRKLTYAELIPFLIKSGPCSKDNNSLNGIMSLIPTLVVGADQV